MTNLSPEICHQMKEARRKAGLSQSELAKAVGCKQSALSMFEQGDGTKLNDTVVNKLAEKFGIELPKAEEVDAGEVDFLASEQGRRLLGSMKGRALLAGQSGWARPMGLPGEGRVIERGFCPNPHCPSNHGYQIEGKLFLRPDRPTADPVGGRYCAVCGEILEKVCPNCGAPVHDGAICSVCGEPYVK